MTINEAINAMAEALQPEFDKIERSDVEGFLWTRLHMINITNEVRLRLKERRYGLGDRLPETVRGNIVDTSA